MTDDVKALERRIERRRELVALRYAETKAQVKDDVAKATKWLPLVAVAGSLAVGIVASRYARSSPAARAAPVYTPRPKGSAKGVVAALLGVAATALRIAASSEVRTFYNAAKAFGSRRR